MSAVVVGEAVPADIAAIIPLVEELYGDDFEVTLTEADLLRDVFADGAAMHLTVAQADGVLVGYAMWNLSYTSRNGRHRIYMADLCVAPVARGQGAGRALVAHLAAICVERGYDRLEWKTFADNPSRAFYDKIGGELRTEEFVLYHAHGDALGVVAGSNP